MFDDKKEPVDIFAETDKVVPRAQGGAQDVITPPVSPSNARGPSKLLLGIIVLAILGLGGGGYYLFSRSSRSAPQASNDNAAPQVAAPAVNTSPAPAPAPTNVPAPTPAPVNVPAPAPTPSPTNQPDVNANAPVPTPLQPVQPPDQIQQPIDSDGDGLSDQDEINIYHTDPHNPDTDHDGLTDYEEVKIYHTDPKNPDTDGDGFLDGQEVKAGFDPLNPAKGARLFSVPKK